MRISVIVPVHNESENIGALYSQLIESLAVTGREFELLFIDDGSTDDSRERLRELAAQDERVKVVLFRRNFGQTAALKAGLDLAAGDVLVTLDGDLQNDPADIPLLIAKLDEGFDLVHGWRQDRHDAFLSRKVPSKIANWLISRATKFPIHDLGCTLKAIRREIAQELELYGEMHRFIPILAHRRGARCAEIVVRHHARRFGRTKYGIGRTTRVILDLITVKYLLDYFASPMKLFGKFAFWCLALSAFSVAAVVAMKLWGQIDMTGNPLLLLSVVSALASLQFVGLGLLGEVNARIYFSSAGQQSYAVREHINFESGGAKTLPFSKRHAA